MKFKLVLFLSLTSLSGCASIHQYHSKPLDNRIITDEYDVSGKIEKNIDPGFLVTDIKNDIILYINGELVVQAPLHRDESAEIVGQYRSKEVRINCHKPTLFASTRCDVHIDRKLVGDLLFTLQL